MLEDLLIDAEQRLADEGIGGDIYLFKNNTDSAGNSYGCHENYLIVRAGEFSRISDVLLPFLVTRQLICGAGKVLQTPKAATFCLSSAPSTSGKAFVGDHPQRPIINTRDEPHADAEKYRRLHVIVGDSNMCESTTMLKVGTAALVLEMIEAGVPFRDFSLDNPIRAIREVSHDLTGRRPVRLAGGRQASALDIQREYYAAPSSTCRPGSPTLRSSRWSTCGGASSTRSRARTSPRSTPRSTGSSSASCSSATRTATTWSCPTPKIAQLDLAYHDIKRGRGVFDLLQRKGLAARITTDEEIEAAVNDPPQTTRAKLRGEFISAAQEAGRDFTVDWVHLKLNDQAQRTVLCKDPFRSVDERVKRLIASM